MFDFSEDEIRMILSSIKFRISQLKKDVRYNESLQTALILEAKLEAMLKIKSIKG